MATHAPITGALTRASTFILNRRRRAAIEAEIDLCLSRVERLVARLDRQDASFEDLEDDDPAGDVLDKGEGIGDFGRGLLPDRPVYALDQRRGPTNAKAAARAHLAHEMGMVPNGRGGWRYPN